MAAVSKLMALTVLVTAATGTLASVPEGTVGVLLPVVDRAGNREAATQLQDGLRAGLEGRVRWIEPAGLRDVLRQLRLRDPGAASPEQLDRLATMFRADWLLSATLHAASTEQGTPQVIAAGRLHVAHTRHLAWAGFQARTGLDDETILGLGRTDDPASVVHLTGLDLANDLLDEERKRRARGPTPHLYRARDLDTDAIEVIAVVPFDAVGQGPGTMQAAQIVTDILLAALHDRGVRVVHPGTVAFVLRERGVLWRGSFDQTVRAAITIRARPDLILSGTVDHFRVSLLERRPHPQVSLGMHAVRTSDGTLVFVGSLDRYGYDGVRLFGTGWVYSDGQLARDSIERLLDGVLPRDHRTRTMGKEHQP